ncbi:ABC transporter permease [Piscibacillus salipiscarius]|uniref:ABC transporter permease n=1 Tax=Piscibacillus salipiscarius TaxID=299480 RepID=UPI0006D06639|nr:hypothetical protein [Piscibacillus salipiscarius]
MGSGQFLKTGMLMKLIIRRDRLRFIIWLFGFLTMTILTAWAYKDLYASQAERQQVASTMENPAITALLGPGFGLDNYTVGAMMAHQMLAITLLIIAVMSVLLVVRHTRAEEEEGKIELIRALPSGRLSNLTSTLLVMSMIYIILSLATGFGLYALGIESMSFNGSMLYGAALGVTGLFFSATTAFFAQLTQTSKGAVGLSFLLVGLSYLIRAIGDVVNDTISWFSPFGWVLRSEVYVNNYWWPVMMTFLLSIVIVIIAMYLNSIRDLGAGFLPSKRGKRDAGALTKSHLGLTIRLQKTSIISWAVVAYVFGATYGSVLGDTDTYFAEIEMMKEVMATQEGVSMTLQFITMIASIMAVLSTIPAVMAVNKLRKEEKRNRTEQLLATALPRVKLFGNYILVAIFTSIITLGAGALGLSSAGAWVIEEDLTFYGIV